MKLVHCHVLLLLVLAIIWLSLPLTSAKSETISKNDDKNSLEGRRFLNLGSFRPFMRVLGMMGIPLLPLLLLRQLIGAGAGANQQGLGGGAGMGSMGALGILGPFGAGAGLGGLRPVGGAGGGLRPLGLRPLGGGGLRPLGGLIGNAANAGQGGAAALFLKKRSTEQEKTNRFSTFLGALAKLEKVVDQYDLSVPDCQRLIVCEVHRKSINPSFGSFTEKMIQAFGVEARLERSKFASNTKSVLKDFLKAARNGLQQRDCSAIYYKCPIAVKEIKEEIEEKKEKNEKNEKKQN
ncbi:keratin, type I cytoskeletal 9-like [Stegodyphus dumicola]|uniref:keratin, type I cytoskeletal 9-like n=1 Tax=Stegodyphus dumicola TaxID=202533 RepID=UPI0015A8C166|nr:keratin, type I cytoskeletal 9-like [Stegodyphus dumicola]